MLSRNHPDRIRIAFDGHRLAANAGLVMPATLARHLGFPHPVDQRLDLGPAPARAHAGDKLMTPVASAPFSQGQALAGGSWIDDADALRASAGEALATSCGERWNGSATVGPGDHQRCGPTAASIFATYSYHGFITDRDGETLELEADHRRHAEIENAIRDLKYGVGLNHLPSERFAANGAWLAAQVMAHNLARWTARLGLDERIVTTKTLRRRFFALAGRLTRSARRLTLHLPKRWPWEEQFSRALARLQAIPLPT